MLIDIQRCCAEHDDHGCEHVDESRKHRLQ
jgi:hypothetical protein